MNASLARHAADRLSLLYHASQGFNSSLDLDEVLNRVMDEVVALTRAERGFVMLLEEDDRQPVFRAARGMDRETIQDPEFQISRGVVDRVAREGEPLLTSNAQTDERFRLRLSVQSLGLRSILCAPLKVQERIIGVIYVDSRLQAGLFAQDDLELLAAIASSAAIAVENARLYRMAVDRGRIERELQMARELQAGLLPHSTPHLPGWDVAAAWQPAREVAGDFYDFIENEAGLWSMVIADVSGKGMPAALFMAVTRSIVRASLSQPLRVAEGIERANRLICADSTAGMFVTVFCACLQPGSGDVTYVNAGHNPPLLLARRALQEGEEIEELRPTGMALGVLEEVGFRQQVVHLEPGDVLLLYTDGVTDAARTPAERFEMKRLHKVMLDHGHKSAGELVSALAVSVARFTGATEQFDDMAIVVLKRTG